jgi:hypothetical protein
MAYCAPRGIRYHDFLGWDDLSRDAAIAWQVREHAKCSGCGQLREEWMERDPETGELTEMFPAPFRVVEHWCPACAAVGQARKVRGDDFVEGRHFAFTRSHASPPHVHNVGD